MPESHQEPYWSHAITKLPKDSVLMQRVSEYLYMRLFKNPKLSIGEWDECIDELVNVFDLQTNTKKGKKDTKVRKLVTKQKVTVDELCYFFQVATSRKWNHVYFTKEQDRMYDNMSFYQDPYWQKLINDVEKRKILEEELNGTSG